MTALATAAAITVSLWSHPGAAPCAQPGGDNPCWSAPYVSAEVIEAREAGAFRPDEICDGDWITNTGARDGRAIYYGVQRAEFDEGWLIERGLAYRALDDGRLCIPTRSFGSVHEPEACGNVTTLIRRAGAIPMSRIAATEYTRGGPLLPRITRTWGGASARVAAPLPLVPLPASLALLLSAVALLGYAGVRRS